MNFPWSVTLRLAEFQVLVESLAVFTSGLGTWERAML